MGRFDGGPKVVFSRDKGKPSAQGQPYLGAISVELQSPDSDGDSWVEGAVEVHNPTTDAFEEVEIVVVACDSDGTPLGSTDDKGGPLPAGGHCFVKISGFVKLRGRAVAAVDIYPRLVDVERASVAIDVKWED